MTVIAKKGHKIEHSGDYLRGVDVTGFPMVPNQVSETCGTPGRQKRGRPALRHHFPHSQSLRTT